MQNQGGALNSSNSGKQPGGQKGHLGETLCRTETPDAVIDHYPPACAGCGAPLTEAMAIDHAARQVFDLPEPQPPVVTEHRAHGCRCPACGAQTRASFPDWVTAPAQYGKRIGAIMRYLLHYQLLPEKRLATLMADLFGVRLATATIARISQDCAERFQGFANAVRDQVAAAHRRGAKMWGDPHFSLASNSARLILCIMCRCPPPFPR